MRGRHHAPREVWDAGGMGEGGRPGDSDGLPVADWDLPQIPCVSERHHQEHQKSKITLNTFRISTVAPCIMLSNCVSMYVSKRQCNTVLIAARHRPQSHTTLNINNISPICF